ncbi:MAG TPA: hypothetical protein VIV12_26820 [Streptosporangiaceae bacterium]
MAEPRSEVLDQRVSASGTETGQRSAAEPSRAEARTQEPRSATAGAVSSQGAGTSGEAELPKKPKDPEAEMAAELAMAAEIARVLGAAAGGRPPEAAEETRGQETADSSSAAVPSARSRGSRTAPPERSSAGQATESEVGGPGPGGAPDTSGPVPSAATDGARGAGGATPADGEVAVVPGVARYHRRGCILIRFMGDTDLETMSRQAAEQAGCMACRACQPDQD